MGQEASKPDPNAKLQVIGCGMSRTGTASFSEALKILLGGPVYHGGSQIVGAGEQHLRDWIELHKHTPIQYEADRKAALEGLKSILGGYTATTDLPPILFTEELVELFPDAHVICTVRDPEDWWNSVRAITARTDTEERDENILRFVLALLPTMRYWYAFNVALKQGRMGELYYSSGHKHPHPGQYQQHMEYVTRVVPRERLKFYDVKDGWGPLCKILGVEVPDVPFPRVNDAKATEQIVMTQVRRGLIAWACLGLSVGLLAFIGIRRWK
ncbi:hypothetical protein H2200_012609 [Cladophialophora chaetospira]|uniref:NAD dependent epimerase/dehydratase n=1 Tax=Cladophialophora chaetospira TaxID=386627 RepID=A0AA38WX98_9EURO|nr:hypothetical protein H2200_012609 [Cladophialophora chaetospira]